MSNAVFQEPGVFLAEPVPACQWSFNRERQFHHICGDSAGVFRRASAELLHQHVSIIDDPNRSWAARLDTLFAGAVAVQQRSVTLSQNGYVLTDVPICADGGGVVYAAGFAYRAGQRMPAVPELELAALAALQALETERLRMAGFLHDVVAQCLSSTGLQLELLRLEIEASHTAIPGRIAEIQRSLDDVLKRVRTFTAAADASGRNPAKL